jgi:ABC-type transport system involved in cytochrome c biogenesis permease subunit
MLDFLFAAAFGLYALALLAALVKPERGAFLLGTAVVTHAVATIGRGLAIDFLPLTNKYESFSAMALALGVVAAVTGRRERLFAVPLLALATAALGVAVLLFPSSVTYPPPLMRTPWYPAHVPLSFAAYAVWAAAAAAALVWWRERDARWLTRVEHFAFVGFGLWNLSMICGGVWGVLAWGAYFMWDPKIVWSVILWFHYATFVHVKRAPSLAGRAWVRPVLAVIGFGWLVVAYVGTSFFFGRSSHAF